MLTTLITVSAMFSVVVVAQNYVLEAIRKDASGQAKVKQKIID